jgi:hypothetical protein
MSTGVRESRAIQSHNRLAISDDDRAIAVKFAQLRTLGPS